MSIFPKESNVSPRICFCCILLICSCLIFFHKVGQPYHHTSPFIFHDYRLMHFHLMFHDFGSPWLFPAQVKPHWSPAVTPHLGIDANAKRTRCEWKSPGCLRPHSCWPLGRAAGRARALRSHWKLKLSTWEVPGKTMLGAINWARPEKLWEYNQSMDWLKGLFTKSLVFRASYYQNVVIFT